MSLPFGVNCPIQGWYIQTPCTSGCNGHTTYLYHLLCLLPHKAQAEVQLDPALHLPHYGLSWNLEVQYVRVHVSETPSLPYTFRSMKVAAAKRKPVSHCNIPVKTRTTHASNACSEVKVVTCFILGVCHKQCLKYQQTFHSKQPTGLMHPSIT